ncbi:MAG: DUF7507 domain-containing protein [Desulfitobacteriia bacterium]
MKKELSLFTFMLLLASLLLSANLSSVQAAPGGMRVVPVDAPCIGLYANDPGTPGYQDNVVTFNSDGSMSFDFSKGFGGNSYGFQPGSTYVWDELFFIENLNDGPLQYKIENEGLQYIYVEDSATNLSFVSSGANTSNWGTIEKGQIRPIRIYFTVPVDASLGVIEGILKIITDCPGPGPGPGPTPGPNGGGNGGGQEAPGIKLQKIADVDKAYLGDTVTYTFIVTNTCNDIIRDITILDSMLGEITLDKTTLAPGEKATGTKTYTISEKDFPGPLLNTATATGFKGDTKVESFASESVILEVDTPGKDTDPTKDKDQQADPKEPKDSTGPKDSNTSGEQGVAGDSSRLPDTGGNVFFYILGGFALAGAGILLKRRF